MHVVADVGVGHGVDRREGDVGMPGQDPLDRAGGEVLPVDPQPVAVAPGEVEEARVVAVAEVAGPVHALARALLRSPRRCASSPRSSRRSRCSRSRRSLPSAFARRPSASNSRARTLLLRLGIEDQRAGRGDAERAGGHARRARDRDAALGRAVAVDDLAAEALREAVRGRGPRPRCRRRCAGCCRRRRASPGSRARR